MIKQRKQNLVQSIYGLDPNLRFKINLKIV